MVYRGPNIGEGIPVYHDGVFKGNMSQKVPGNKGTPSGIVKIGTSLDPPGTADFTSVYLDELLFWNRQMSQTEIVMIKNMN